MKPELYISIDVETNGKIPGLNSMLSLGAAAFLEGTEEPVSTYSVNLKEIEGATADPETMEWWHTQPKAWEVCRSDQKDIDYAMAEFSAWVEGISILYKASPVCVASPSGFDFTFVYWYLIRYTGRSPFSFSCIDIKSITFALLGKSYRGSSKKNWRKSWFVDLPHTHIAIDDAIEQGHSFMKMLKEIKGR